MTYHHQVTRSLWHTPSPYPLRLHTYLGPCTLTLPSPPFLLVPVTCSLTLPTPPLRALPMPCTIALTSSPFHAPAPSAPPPPAPQYRIRRTMDGRVQVRSTKGDWWSVRLDMEVRDTAQHT